MDAHANIRAVPAGRGYSQLAVHAKKDGQDVEIKVTFGKDDAVALVRDICRAAGLPEPWKKG